MLASIKKNKFVRHSIIILSLLLFTSCSWFTSNDDNEISFTITGNLTTNGAMPENYAQAMNARTALATAPSGQTIKYKVLLLAAEGDTEPVEGAVSEVASDGSSYSIKYTGSSDVEVQYYLRAVAYYMDGTSEVDVLLSPDTQLGSAVNLKNGTFSQDLEMRPATSGYGEVSLAITLDSATMCDSVTISDESHFQVAKSGSNVTISHKATSADNPKLASGSYPVTVNFYKTVSGLSTPVLVYQFSDVINVFNNLTTNVWVDNGSSAVTSCVITTAMLEDFKTTNIYVDKRYDGEVYLGTYIQPYHSLKDAINFIEKTGNDNSTYTIHVKQVASTMFPDDLVLNSPLEVSKKITVEVYATVPGAKDGFYVIKSDESSDFPLFTVSNTGVLTFESNGAALDRSGFPTQGTKGIVLRTAFEGVQVRGRFNMKGGCITSCSNIAVEINSNGSVKTFEMTGGAITANSGKGVFVPDTGNFVVHGKPYIYGNGSTKTDLILNTGAVMSIKGPFVTGALIGVRTQTAPTITSPVTITSGYGYQTGGYNAGVNPGKYFRSDNGDYGITNDFMLETPAGEAVLSPSGGNFTVGKVINDLKITIDKSFVAKDDTTKKFTFTAKEDLNGTPITIEAGTGEGKVSYSYELRYKGETVPATGDTYYQTGTNSITLKDALPTGDYSIVTTATYKSKTYTAQFDVKIIEVDTITSTNISAMQLESGKKYYLKIDSTITNDNISGLVAKLKNNEDIGDSTLDLSEVNIETLTASLEMGTGNITEIVLPDSMTGVNTLATTNYFQGSSKLVSVIYNGNISMNWGNWAFGYCTSLKNFPWQTLETGRMGNCMFYECTSLETATIPSQVSLIGGYAFYNCSSLVEVHLLGTIPPQLENNECFSGCNSNLVFYVPAGTSAAYEAAGYSNYGTIQEE